jgi:DNA-binding MarR family transcriptional regulator
VGEDRRTRFLETTAEVVAARGLALWTLSIRELRESAGLSADEARELLAEPEAVMAEVFALAVERASRRVRAAIESEFRWLDQAKAGAATLLGFLEAEPALGRFLALGSTLGGERTRVQRAALLASLVEFVDRGRLEGVTSDRAPSSPIAEGVLGGALAIVQNGLLREPPAEPMEMFGAVLSMIVLPYLGPAAARRELERPPPRRRALARATATGRRPVLRKRLTYRTTLVLEAIADYPGASNREVAQRAGIVDQGQVSKLLGRLEEQGLIERFGGHGARGAANAWRLTARGEGLLAAA